MTNENSTRCGEGLCERRFGKMTMPALWNLQPTDLDPMTATISGALIGLWGTYLLGLLVPGPNFAAIAAMSSTIGLRATLPLILGIVCGSSIQAISVIFGLGILWQGQDWETLGRLVGAALLVGVAVHLWKTCSMPPNSGAADRKSGLGRYFAGLATGLSNPITLAAVTAQVLGSASALAGSATGCIAALGIAVLGLLRSVVVATVFATETVRRPVLTLHNYLAGIIAVLFIATAGNIAYPVLAVHAPSPIRQSAADAPHGACTGTALSIKASTAAEYEALCEGVANALAVLKHCGLSVDASVSIETVAGTLVSSGRLAHGTADSASQRIKIVGLPMAKRLQALQPAYAQVSLKTFYSGIVAHELAHLALRKRMEQTTLPLAAQEYVAYAVQVSAYPDHERARFVEQFPAGTPVSLALFSTMLAVVNPDHLAALAWRHFSRPHNGCAFIERMLHGTEAFPPDAEE